MTGSNGTGGGERERAYCEYVRRRALREWAPSLGSRVVELGSAGDRFGDLLADRTLVLGVGPERSRPGAGRGAAPGSVGVARGDLAAVPVASESLTGALLCFETDRWDDGQASRTFAEVARVLQPGGLLLLLDRVSPVAASPERPRGGAAIPARCVERLVELLDAAGLDTLKRIAVRKSPSWSVRWVREGRIPAALWALSARLELSGARRGLHRAESVECLLPARKRGRGFDPVPDLPTFRSMLSSLFLPGRRIVRRPPHAR